MQDTAPVVELRLHLFPETRWRLMESLLGTVSGADLTL